MKKRNTVRCPYCGAQAKLRPATAVYGDATINKDTYVYLCDRYPKCDSYVYAHPQSKEPMGTLANGDLRHKRILAHRAINKLCKSKKMTEREVYKFLGYQLGIPFEMTHIASFGEYMCGRVVQVCYELIDKTRTA